MTDVRDPLDRPVNEKKAQAEALADALRWAENWPEVLRILTVDFGLTNTEIATATATKPITVARWLSGQTEVRDDTRLQQLTAVVRDLAARGEASPRLLLFWIRSLDTRYGTNALTLIGRGQWPEAFQAGIELTSLNRRSPATSAEGQPLHPQT